MRSDDAKKKDLAFILDQKTERKMVMSLEEDYEYRDVMERKFKRAEKLKELSRDMETAAEKEEERDSSKSEVETSIEDSDSELDLDSPAKKRKSDKIIIELTADELIECTSEVSARFNVGI